VAAVAAVAAEAEFTAANNRISTSVAMGIEVSEVHKESNVVRLCRANVAR
jgi:hypothetical protein